MQIVGARTSGFVFFTFGFAATAGQVLLLRLGIVLGGGNELVLGAFFGSWFLGIAAGAALGRKIAWAPGRFRWLAGLFPSLIFLNALGVVSAAVFNAPAVGHLPSLGRGIFLAAALAFLPGAGIGLSFPAGAAAAGGIARLFLIESWGSAVGGVMATVLFVRFDPLGVLGILAAAGFAFLPGKVALLAPAASVALWGGWGPLADLRLGMFRPVGRVVAEVNSPYQHILLTEYEGQRSLFLNGQTSGQSPDPAAVERLRVFRRLTDGSGETALIASWPWTADESGQSRVVWIQPDPALVRLRALTGDPELVAVSEDPRTFLGRQTERFSLMVLDLPPPASVAQERLFTADFFRSAARALKPDGVLVLTLPASENYWGEETARLIGGLHRALQSAFPDVLVAVGPVPCLMASTQTGLLEERLKALRYGEEGAVYSALFPVERIQEFSRRLAAGPGRAASDARPFAYLDALAVREKMDRQIPIAGTLLSISPWMLALLGFAFLPYLPARRRPLFQVFSTGAMGIGAFLLLSIRFQAAHGTYYGTVGLLTGLFMLGLAFSAPFGRRLAKRSAASWLPDAAALAFLGLLVLVPSGPPWLFGAFFILGGAVTGLPFVFQGISLGDNPDAAARMEFHDHLGAALGALVTGLLLMPLLGLTGTIWALAGMKGVSLVINLKPIP